MSVLNATRPLIVIGVPCYGKVDAQLLEDWMRWAFHLGRRMPAFDFQICIVSKKEQFRARNFIVDEARKMDAAYLLMIDDDMIINSWQTFGDLEAGDASYAFLEQLVAHDKDICGVLYYQRLGGCHPVLMTGSPEHKGYRYLRDDEIEHRLQDVDVAGGGCLLIKMRVFDRLPMPFFKPEFDYGTDVQLCRAAKERGFTVAADTSIELGHLKEEAVVITSRNRQLYALTETIPGEVKRAYDSEALFGRLVDDVCRYTGYPDAAALAGVAQGFMTRAEKRKYATDAEWYRQHGRERVARQAWFNTQSPHKRQMTEFVLSSVDHTQELRILDFGCGIGIPAFFFAERGHKVTAMDIAGTGTLEFLKWRVQGTGVPVTIRESAGGVPELGVDDVFDVIVAMDVLEHIEAWREAVPRLVAHLSPGGVLFANNAILEDDVHPEHYPINNAEFVEVCLQAGLLPVNQVTYQKRTPRIPRTGTPATQELTTC